MSRRIILSPDAQADVSAIEHWYRAKDPSLAFAFRTELRSTLRVMAQYPHAFLKVRGGTRRALMKQFPYVVYFRVANGEVAVLAVLHKRRLQRY